MNYITRERVHVDRIATAWVIRKLVDVQMSTIRRRAARIPTDHLPDSFREEV